MDDVSASLVLGIAGLVATVLTSVFGLYYTARARTAPMRELLYEQQLALFVRTVECVGRIKLYVVILGDPESPYREQAIGDLGTEVSSLSRIKDTAAALLPVDLFAEVGDLVRLTSSFLERMGDGPTSADDINNLEGHAAKLALLIREHLGVEKLSEENLRVLGGKNDFERIRKIERAKIVPPRTPPDPAAPCLAEVAGDLEPSHLRR